MPYPGQPERRTLTLQQACGRWFKQTSKWSPTLDDNNVADPFKAATNNGYLGASSKCDSALKLPPPIRMLAIYSLFADGVINARGDLADIQPPLVIPNLSRRAAHQNSQLTDPIEMADKHWGADINHKRKPRGLRDLAAPNQGLDLGIQAAASGLTRSISPPDQKQFSLITMNSDRAPSDSENPRRSLPIRNKSLKVTPGVVCHMRRGLLAEVGRADAACRDNAQGQSDGASFRAGEKQRHSSYVWCALQNESRERRRDEAAKERAKARREHLRLRRKEEDNHLKFGVRPATSSASAPLDAGTDNWLVDTTKQEILPGSDDAETSVASHPTTVLPTAPSIVEKNRNFTVEKSQSFGLKLLASFLDFAGANGKTDLSRHKNQSFGAADHEVRAYNGPFSPESLEATVGLDGVKKHIRSGRFGPRHVYAISGLRVARQSFMVTDGQEEKTEVGVRGSGPVPAGTVPFQLGDNF
ncbi:hypothetical protein MAPG_11330 [Magnaporthiopsis poae ATCC 64411]|uniref:Uncharacterized protein n=1 Tax=Magnaporthiopsis poae (strain ATCC 64411 / 73-15) TaxID=644358 RepID=A0A0C4EEZ7_MAGP6|nr:hypothetical protein MAPG_11330 [Magnaporthiopsis poae ATCC 64411]